MKSLIIVIFLMIVNFNNLFGQRLKIQFPAISFEISKSNKKGFSMCDKYEVLTTESNYFILSSYYNYYYNQYTYDPFANPIITILDKNKNIIFSDKLENPKVEKGQHINFLSYMIFGQKGYVIYRIREDGLDEDFVFPLIKNQESYSFLKPIKLEQTLNSAFLIKSINGKYYSSSPSLKDNSLEIISQEFNGNWNEIKSIKIKINLPIAGDKISVNRIEFDNQANAHIIFNIDNKYYYGYFNSTTNELKTTTLTGIFKEIGFDKIGNTFILTSGNQLEGIFNNDCFTITKCNEGNVVAKKFISISDLEKLRYINNYKVHLTKVKETDQFLNTTSQFKNCRFGISEDGSIAGFYISERNLFNYDYYVPSYESFGFHWITFKTSTLENKVMTIGKDFWVSNCNLVNDYIAEHPNSISLIFYNNSKNVTPDFTSVNISEHNMGPNFNPSVYVPYYNTVDSDLNFSTGRVLNSDEKTIIKLPLIQLSKNEYFVLGSENTKFNKYRVGTINFK